MVVLREPPEKEDQHATASTISLPNVGVEAKEESECKRVSSATRTEIAESKLGIGSL